MINLNRFVKLICILIFSLALLSCKANFNVDDSEIEETNRELTEEEKFKIRFIGNLDNEKYKFLKDDLKDYEDFEIPEVTDENHVLGKYGWLYHITEVEKIGSQQYSDLAKQINSLSEYQILNEYCTQKFILSIPAKKPALTWDRRRILFAMMINSVLITDGSDAQYLGKPFQLDKSIFTKSDKELKSIADDQKDYFFSHVKTEKQIENTINEFLK